MKKSLILAFSFIFTAIAANAIIVVKESGKTNKYPAGSVVRVYSTVETSVEYGGITITIPKNTRVTLREEMVSGERTVTVRGEDLSGIKFGDLKISAKGSVLFSYNPSSKEIDVTNGTLLVTDKSGTPSLFYAGQTYKPGRSSEGYTAKSEQKKERTSSEEEAPQDLLQQDDADQDSSRYEQSSKDIIEDPVLSKSVPS